MSLLKRLLLSVVLFCAVGGLPGGCATSEPTAVIPKIENRHDVAALKELGAIFERDERRKVVRVDLQMIEDVTDKDLKHIRGLPYTRIVRLFGTSITDAGVVHLACLEELEHLSVGRTKVTDISIELLKKRKDTLIRLGLSETRITDKGLKELEEFKKLKELFIFGNDVTHAAVQRLKKANPDLEIILQ